MIGAPRLITLRKPVLPASTPKSKAIKYLRVLYARGWRWRRAHLVRSQQGSFNPNALVVFLKNKLGWFEIENEQQLNSYLIQGNTFPRNAYFFLEPPNKSKFDKRYFVFMQLKADASSKHPWKELISLRLWMACKETKCDPGCVEWPEIRLYGFRFECPELGDCPNKHAHVQMLSDPAMGGQLDDLCIPWMDANYPAVPIRAGQIDELVLCAAASIYGIHGLHEWRVEFASRLQGAMGTLDGFIGNSLDDAN